MNEFSFLAQWQDRTLLELRPGSETVLASGVAYQPLTHALCALGHNGTILLVHNVVKQQWELPGGIVKPGESAGETALRELFEESCQRPLEMWFRGLICYSKGPQRETEYGALYCGCLSQLFPFKPNHEVDKIRWWSPRELLTGLNPIDAALAQCFGPESQ